MVKLPFFKYLETSLNRNHSINLAAVMRVMNSAVELLKKKNTYLLENVLFQALTLKVSLFVSQRDSNVGEMCKSTASECIRVCSSALVHSQIKWCRPVSAGFGKGLKLRI